MTPEQLTWICCGMPLMLCIIILFWMALRAKGRDNQYYEDLSKKCYLEDHPQQGTGG